MPARSRTPRGRAKRRNTTRKRKRSASTRRYSDPEKYVTEYNRLKRENDARRRKLRRRLRAQRIRKQDLEEQEDELIDQKNANLDESMKYTNEMTKEMIAMPERVEGDKLRIIRQLLEVKDTKKHDQKLLKLRGKSGLRARRIIENRDEYEKIMKLLRITQQTLRATTIDLKDTRSQYSRAVYLRKQQKLQQTARALQAWRRMTPQLPRLYRFMTNSVPAPATSQVAVITNLPEIRNDT